MKNIFQILFIFCVISISSCDFTKTNIDPNNITEDKLLLNQRLPTLEYFFGNVLASDIPKTVGNTMGQTIYIQGNTGLNTYLYGPADPSKISLWGSSYSRVLFTADQIIKDADSKNAPLYKGISKIIYAVGLANLASIWGDVPYKQLFNIGDFPDPVFDSQESVYDGIQKLLNDAIIDLTNTTSALKPTADDFIFNGDVAKWTKTAYALKARYHLHTIRVRQTSYDLAEAALANALQSNADNCVFKFVAGNPSQTHPLYNERVGTQNTQVDTKFTDLLNAKNDPRLPFYSTVRSSLTTGKRALYGPLYSSKDSYMPVITYEECMFMKAEITMAKSGKAAAESDFKTAIKASLERVCSEKKWTSDSGTTALSIIPITSSILGTFINSQGNIDSLATDADVWKRIFEQKYIAMFLQAETWNDYRRTKKYIPEADGLPILTPRAGNALPRRYNYPSNEINYNKSTPADKGIFATVWWDN